MTQPKEQSNEGSTRIRPAAVAGAFYPADRVALQRMIDGQLDYGRELVAKLAGAAANPLPQGAPKAVIVPHAGYVYSGTTAALAYALLERGRGRITRAVIVGPTHRVAVRGVAAPSADAFATPLGVVSIDTDAEKRALEQAPALIVNDPTHAREHAVEVQIPFLQTVLGPDIEIVPLNAGDASPREVGDVLRALWGGPETVIVISSDLSHYHPQEYARALDDATIDAIGRLDGPIRPNRACGAYPVNGLLDVLTRGLAPADPAGSSADGPAGTAGAASSFTMRLLGRSTSGDDGVVAIAGEERPAMRNPDEAVVGYASFAVWEDDDHPQSLRRQPPTLCATCAMRTAMEQATGLFHPAGTTCAVCAAMEQATGLFHPAGATCAPTPLMPSPTRTTPSLPTPMTSIPMTPTPTSRTATCCCGWLGRRSASISGWMTVARNPRIP
ncbi:AmmeMemoRadiSam system protein B [Bifidobacterium stellenboschense]|uniref:Dioxygenase n=1 Tax=Bifidobacterium stellenboschense TaxID=762211 RepID=A0A087DX15_9BIFI|nr:AmmeMemoRadiSam system protein B [Bifidobacterium stellenboschense]KFJ00066.1 dioxygenase [Bifidobacterium stellenboschense]